MNRAFVLVLLAPLALTALMLPGAHAQSTPLSVRVAFDLDSAHSDASPLDDGRLAPGETLRVHVTTTVSIPALQVCLVPVNVRYTVIRPTYATAIINPATDSKTIEYQGYGVTPSSPVNPLSTTDVVFDSLLTISPSSAAPALFDGTYVVKADVTLSGSWGCTLAGSSGFGELAVKNDYAPGFRILAMWGEGADVSLTIESGANGPSVFTFEYGRTGGEWTPSSVQLYLESRHTQGADAVIEGTILLPHAERPPHWTKEIRITQASDASLRGLATLQRIIVVPPGANADAGAPQSLDPESYAPGPGGFGILLALCVGLIGSATFRRRP